MKHTLIFLALLIFSFNNAPADVPSEPEYPQYHPDSYPQYDPHVEKIVYEPSGDHFLAHIFLTTDQELIFQLEKSKEHLLTEFEEELVPGSRAYIDVIWDDDPGLGISCGKDYLFKVYPTLMTKKNLLQITEVINEGIIFFKKHTIVLSDGSHWQFSIANQYWKKNDRIIISRAPHVEGFLLININVLYSENGDLIPFDYATVQAMPIQPE